MGLDQYAYYTKKENAIDDEHFKGYEDVQCEDFYWRKNQPLQNWMRNLWMKKTGNTDPWEFNCVLLRLSEEDIKALRADIENGVLDTISKSKYYDKERDLQFCDEAEQRFAKGYAIYYEPWW